MKFLFQNYNDSRVVWKCRGRSLTDCATRLGGNIALNDNDQS